MSSDMVVCEFSNRALRKQDPKGTCNLWSQLTSWREGLEYGRVSQIGVPVQWGGGTTYRQYFRERRMKVQDHNGETVPLTVVVAPVNERGERVTRGRNFQRVDKVLVQHP